MCRSSSSPRASATCSVSLSLMPYQIGRFVHGHKVRTEANSRSKTSPAELLKRIYFDSLVFEPKALRYLIDLVGADHICIGTDSPFDMQDVAPADTLEANDIGAVAILAASPLVLESYGENRAMGSLVLIDPATNRTVAAAMVQQVAAEA